MKILWNLKWLHKYLHFHTLILAAYIFKVTDSQLNVHKEVLKYLRNTNSKIGYSYATAVPQMKCGTQTHFPGEQIFEQLLSLEKPTQNTTQGASCLQ